MTGPLADGNQSMSAAGSDTARLIWDPDQNWGAVERGEASDIAAIYAAQREHGPVAWREFDDGQGFWTTFDYAHAEAIASNPALFSSAFTKYGMILIPIELDPPDHAKYRVLLTKLINPKRMRRFEEQIRHFVRTELVRLRLGETTFLELTGSLPIETFCFVVGEEDSATWRAISRAREANNDPRLARQDAQTTARRVAANTPLVDYCRQQIAAHRLDRRDDIVSDILDGLIDGRPITDDEALRMISLIYIAGHRTTTATLRGAIVQLCRNPQVQQQLHDDPGLIGAAIEEIVRLETPIHGLPRMVTQDVEFGGQQLRKGDQILPNFGAANLDPAVFDEPDRFRLDRVANRHMGFGMGLHHCAGAALARLQLRVLLEEVTGAMANLTLTGPVKRLTWPHYGPVDLPVVFTSRT
jgi:cytochrome P450